jgi:hypothetical protein
MGYTHYWYLNPRTTKTENYNQAYEALSKIAVHGQVSGCLAGPRGNGQIETQERVAFNGVEDQAHETFSISKDPFDLFKRGFIQEDEQGFIFSFCKTARKRYDVYVTACLIVLKHFLKEDIKIKSDGRPEDFEIGLRLAEHIIQTPLKNPIRRERS